MAARVPFLIEEFFTRTNQEQIGILGLVAHRTRREIPWIEVVDSYGIADTAGSPISVTLPREELLKYIKGITGVIRGNYPDAYISSIHSHPNLGSVGPSRQDAWFMKNMIKGIVKPAVIIDPVGRRLSVTSIPALIGGNPISHGGLSFIGSAGRTFAEVYMFSTAIKYPDKGEDLGISRSVKFEQPLEPKLKIRPKSPRSPLRLDPHRRQQLKITLRARPTLSSFLSQLIPQELLDTVSDMLRR